MAQCVKCGKEGATYQLSRFSDDPTDSFGELIAFTPIFAGIVSGMVLFLEMALLALVSLVFTIDHSDGLLYAALVPPVLTWLAVCGFVFKGMVDHYRDYWKNGPRFICNACYREAVYSPATDYDCSSSPYP